MKYRHALAAAVAVFLVSAPFQALKAETDTNFGSDIAEEQAIIDALNPNSPAKPKTRGIRLMKQPATGGDQQVSAPPPAPAAEPAAPQPVQQVSAPPPAPAAEPAAPQPAQDSSSSIAMQIQFEYNSANLTDYARSQLDPLGTALNSPELSSYSFRFEGFTDAIGTYEYNFILSKRRADAVKSYLVANYGVDRSRIITIGRGMDDLLTPQDPANAANRRVEITTIGK